MLLDLFDSSMSRIGILNHYTMAQYTEELNGVGEFEIDVAATEIDTETLNATKYILFETDVIGIVKTLNSTDDEKQDIKIKGFLGNYILTYRVVPTTQSETGTRSAIVRKAVTDNFISPTNSNRRISKLRLGATPEGDVETITKQKTGGYVEDFIADTLNDSDMGHRVKPVIANEYDQSGDVSTNITALDFEVIKGVDHSRGNAGGEDVVEFSQDLRNILSADLTTSDANYRNYVYVAGEANEGEEPRTILGMPIGEEAEGLERYELYVDARDLQSTYSEEVKTSSGTETVERTYTAQEYEEMLRKRGLEKASEYIKEEVFNVTIDTNRTQFKYGVDYKLGDYVSVVDKNLGIVAKCLVNSVTKSITEQGEMIDIEFGKPILSWLTRIRKGGL